MKVRQPLSELRIKNSKLSAEYLDLIRDELNVKTVTVHADLSSDVWLDTAITSELKEEGKVRDAIRSIQAWRKEQGLRPGQAARDEVPELEREFFSRHAEEIMRATNVEF